MRKGVDDKGITCYTVFNMKSRKELLVEERKIRDKAILDDYFKRSKNGGFIYSVRELAIRHKISLPQVYKVLERNGVDTRTQ